MAPGAQPPSPPVGRTPGPPKRGVARLAGVAVVAARAWPKASRKNRAWCTTRRLPGPELDGGHGPVRVDRES